MVVKPSHGNESTAANEPGPGMKLPAAVAATAGAHRARARKAGASGPVSGRAANRSPSGTSTNGDNRSKTAVQWGRTASAQTSHAVAPTSGALAVVSTGVLGPWD